MSQNNWEADKMLDVYIYDYLVKRGLSQSAKAFLTEAKVSTDPVAINAPGGFLFEWWSVFWDIFIARTNEKHSEVAASYIESQQLKAREVQQAAQQLQLDKALKQSSLLQPGTAQNLNPNLSHQNQHGLGSNLGQNLSQNTIPSLSGTPNQNQNQNQNMGQNLGPNPSPTLTTAQQNFQIHHLHLQLQQRAQHQQQRGREANGGMNLDMAAMRGGGGSMEEPAQKITRQQQQQQQQQQQRSHQNVPEPKLEGTALRGSRGGGDSANLFSGGGGVGGNKAQFGGEGGAAGQGSPLQLQQHQLKGWNQNQNQRVSPSLFATPQQLHHFQSLTPQQQQQVLASAGADLQERKVRQMMSARGRTTTTGGPTSNPPTPSAQDAGDVSSGPRLGGHLPLVHSASITGKQPPLPNHNHNHNHNYSQAGVGMGVGVGVGLGAGVGVGVGCVDAVETYLSPEDEAHESIKGLHGLDANGGFSFVESGCMRGHESKVVCCHFSPDGGLLASGGHDKRVHLWGRNRQLKATLEEHSHYVTDVRFSATSLRLATSSFDKTIKIWDAENPYTSLRTLSGHSTFVTSVDFHPLNEDMVASCDGDNEIKLWSVNQGTCTQVFKGATTQIRFHPHHGRTLATASDNVVTIFDVESCTPIHVLQMHTQPVQSLCWDAAGEYVASVSEDSVRVWSVGPGKEGACVHDLVSSGNKFHSGAFHPRYPSLLVIGGYQTLELWNMVENKSMTVFAHEGLVAALATSPTLGIVASGSHDKTVKLWT